MESKREIDSDVIDQRKKQLDRMFYELASKFKKYIQLYYRSKRIFYNVLGFRK